MRDQLEQVAETSGKRPEGLDGPEMPPGMDAIHEAFRDLDATRGVGEAGPLPISYTEIRSWCILTGVRLDPFAVECIVLADRLVRGIIAEAMAERRGS